MAHAAGNEARELLPLSLDELFATPVITASRHQEARTDSPAHILVFTREQIRERRYRNLADLLEDLPAWTCSAAPSLPPTTVLPCRDTSATTRC